MMSEGPEYATLNSNPLNTCIVCYKNVDIFSIGMCEHPVCFECSTRMRVLCQQNECPICRQELPKVVFTKENKPFRHLKKTNLFDNKYNIYFEDQEIQEKFNKLLAHSCNVCKTEEVFNTFLELKDHMWKTHRLRYCELCIDNLKIFSKERRCYNRADLDHHRKRGDVDDKSHKGHPLCKFCERFYMDNDELYRHLRREHLYCHFCDADGLHHYYPSYSDLREHFRSEHFLCEEGNCVEEQLTSVFRSDIDLKAHKANVHCRQLGRAAAKQARTLELEFTLAPRPANNRRIHSGRNYHNQEFIEQSVPEPQPNTEVTFVRQPEVDVQSTEQFPSLGNATPIIPMITQGRTRGNLTIRSTRKPLMTEEDFPALGSSDSPSCSGISNTVNLSVSQGQSSSESNVSIHVNHKNINTVTTTVSGNNIRIRPSRSDFPALSGSEIRTKAPNVGKWTKVTTRIVSAPVLTTPPAIQSGADFPSLKPKSSKSSMISIVPSRAQTSESHNNASTSVDSTKGKAKKKKSNKNGSVADSVTKKLEPPAKSTSNINNSDNSTKDAKKNGKKNKSVVTDNDSSQVNSLSLNVNSANNSNNVQRKRSELKIDSLKPTNNNIVRAEDFPALGGATNGPPGFSKPPPGFDSNPTSSPPPGFTSKQLNDNRLTFTNSSGESYSIVPNNSQFKLYTYSPPPDFQKRNKSLVASVNEALGDEESIGKFRYVSGLFRQSVCDAEEFYIRCRTSLGISTFEQIFPELMLLLPDIEKQRELFQIHKREAIYKNQNLDECKTCGQIVRTSELKDHVRCHELERNFPALGIGNQSTNNWARK